jgi:hypothetical protein
MIPGHPFGGLEQLFRREPVMQRNLFPAIIYSIAHSKSPVPLALEPLILNEWAMVNKVLWGLIGL